jgi:hypothetical protein
MTRFLRDERGTFAVLGAMMISMLLGAGALGIDVSYGWWVKSKLQAAADAAALAAAQNLPDTAAASSAAVSIAPQNVNANFGTVVAASDVQIGTYDPSTGVFTAGGGTSAVQVTAGRTAAKGNATPVFLAGIFGWRSDINARAIAYRLTSGPAYCVVVLNTANAVGAFSAQGGGDFSVPNCGVYVNSSHSKAASSSGASTARARSFCLVGGYSGTFTATPTTGCAVAADPLASVPEPTLPAYCPASAYTSSTPPADCTYTGSITWGSNRTFSGKYYFKNATVTINGGNMTGTETMWYFDATSTLDLGSSGTVNLTAPSSGTYKGIAIFQSRSAPVNNVMKITGSADFLLDGTLYMPRAELQLNGNSTVSVNGKTGYVIAYELHYTGASTFTVGTWGGTQALGTASKPYLVQ